MLLWRMQKLRQQREHNTSITCAFNRKFWKIIAFKYIAQHKASLI